MEATAQALTQGSPMEMSLDEYSDLLVEISKLSEDDALLELLEAARFGETDIVRALVASFPVLLNKAMDDSGVTPLHKAAANGHISTVHALIDAKSPFLKNKSGNTPLHWAASNGHAQVVALLLEHFSDIDVLDRNEFGRSSLTEGFGSKSTETAKLLLAHSSASEEKLLMGAVETDDQAQENEDDTMAHAKLRKSKGSIIHDFSFGMETDKTCRIRELAISDDPFGSSPLEDTTGLGVWCASLVMARWMVDMASRFDGKTTIELGAGCGVPGLTLATHATLEHLWVTDLNPETVANLQFNVELNNLCQSTTACTIDWDNTVTWPETMVDTIIGSDLIYSKSIVPLLKKVVNGLLRPGGWFFYVAPVTGRDGLPEFLQELQGQGFILESKTVAPPRYHENPLKSKDEEECYLHFTDLASWTFVLYEFRKESPT